MESTTTPIGLLRRAQEFFAAGDVVLRATGDKVSIPAYFLFGHSIELSLKAFLLAKGVKIKVLKGRKFGHDLSSLLGAAQERGLATVLRIKDREAGTIELLSYDYMAKRFEYHVTDTYYLPFIEVTRDVTENLAYRLEPFCQHASHLPEQT